MKNILRGSIACLAFFSLMYFCSAAAAGADSASSTPALPSSTSTKSKAAPDVVGIAQFSNLQIEDIQAVASSAATSTNAAAQSATSSTPYLSAFTYITSALPPPQQSLAAGPATAFVTAVTGTTTGTSTASSSPQARQFTIFLTAGKTDSFACMTFQWIGRGTRLGCGSATHDTYTVIIDQKTTYLYADRSAASSTMLRIGDRFNVYGHRDSKTGVIQANILRDLDELPTPTYGLEDSFSNGGLEVSAPQGTNAEVGVYAVIPFILQFQNPGEFSDPRDKKGAYFLAATSTTEIPGMSVTFTGCIPDSPCQPPIQTDRAFLTGRPMEVGNYTMDVTGEYYVPLPPCAASVLTDNFNCEALKKAPLHVEHLFQILVRK